MAEDVSAPHSLVSAPELGWTFIIPGAIALIVGLGCFFRQSNCIALFFFGLGVCGIGFGLRARFGPAWAAIASAGLALAGIGLFFHWFGSFEKPLVSAHWPSAPATIIRSDPESFTTTEKVGKDVNYVTFQIAMIEYNYSVNGVNYASNRISLLEQKKGDASFLLKKYPIYKQTQAYYNPKNPSESVLEPGKKNRGWLLPAISILLLAIGSWMAIRYFQRYLETLS